MSKLTINNDNNYEHLCNVILTKEKYPIAFKHKVDELMRLNGMSREDAEQVIDTMEIPLEIYYHEGYGLFAVDSEFCSSTDEIFSPFNAEKIPFESDRH